MNFLVLFGCSVLVILVVVAEGDPTAEQISAAKAAILKAITKNKSRVPKYIRLS